MNCKDQRSTTWTNEIVCHLYQCVTLSAFAITSGHMGVFQKFSENLPHHTLILLLTGRLSQDEPTCWKGPADLQYRIVIFKRNSHELMYLMEQEGLSHSSPFHTSTQPLYKHGLH